MPPKSKSKPAAKKGGPAGAIAAMKAKRERELEEERRRKEEEAAEERRLEEERLRLEEEERQRAEKKKDDKEKKKEDAKTIAQRKKMEENLKKIERMKASGMNIPPAMLAKLQGEAETGGEAKPEKKKVQAETLAQKKKRLEREKKEKAAQESVKEEEEEKKEAETWEDEDWEDQLDHEEQKKEVHADPAEGANEESRADHEEGEEEDETEEKVEELKEEKKMEEEKEEKEAVLRSPICCVLGHVDTGKTKLLDCIRKTNVQHGEAGGITQQIGASFFPVENLLQKTARLSEHLKQKLTIKVPGLLVIDTPGHESFSNLRGRGSALCDIAILVIDIMHGLEPQTKESIQLLKSKKTPFVVALNKVDRLYDWSPKNDSPFPLTYKLQKDYVKAEFEQRLQAVITELAEQGLNSCLYTKNKNFLKNVSLVPTSAHTGEGIPDLLMLMVQLTQRHMNEKLTFTEELRCTVLEVKKIEGHGMTIDVILVNGTLREGDTILVCGLNGPIVTQVRALLTPHPMREIRVKGEYVHHKEIRAAQGIKIAATGLEEAVPGTALLVVREGDDIEELQEEVQADLGTIISRTQGEMGVAVQASTLGALEALLSFLKDCKIPVSTVGVGDLHKKTIMRVVGIKEKNPKYGVILCFDVSVTKEAQEFADKEGIKIFTADIIYHLQDKFIKYLEDFAAGKQEANKATAVFPCVLRTVPNQVFNKKNPIILGMTVVEGQLRPGTPLIAFRKENGKTVHFHVGKVESAERDHKPQKVVKKGDQAVAVKIKTETVTFGRQIDESTDLYSEISRESIDALKESFREEMDNDDWKLVQKLKKKLNIF